MLCYFMPAPHPTLCAQQKSYDSLSPEQENVIRVLFANWPNELNLKSPISHLPSRIPTGYIRISSSEISADQIPSDRHWIWRQCNAKIVTVVGETSVVIQKLNTRDRKQQFTSGLSRPSYKLWNLRVYHKDVSFTFLYCEKGVNFTVPEDKSSGPSLVSPFVSNYYSQENYYQNIISTLSVDEYYQYLEEINTSPDAINEVLALPFPI